MKRESISRLYDRQAMIINRHKFKLSVTNWAQRWALRATGWHCRHAHCVNKPHNDQKITEAATRVATRCGRAERPKKRKPKANTITVSGAIFGAVAAIKRQAQSRVAQSQPGVWAVPGAGAGAGPGWLAGKLAWCWQVKQRIKFIKYPHLKTLLAKKLKT